MSEKSIYTLESVEQQLKKIQKKYESKKKIQFQKSNKELIEELKHLDQELDYLNVSFMSEPYNLDNLESTKKVLCDVVNSSFDLIRLHKDTMEQQDNMIEKNSILNSDINMLKKQIDSLKKSLESKERQIEIIKNQKIMEKQKNVELKTKITDTQRQMSILTSQKQSSVTALNKLNKKFSDENKVRNEKLLKNSGLYISSDKKIAQVLNEYEEKEEKYKLIISKLQNTNKDLLVEILELRNQVPSK